MNRAKLYLIPNTLGPSENPALSMGSSVSSTIESLDCFAVENLKESRRLFVRWGLKHKIDSSDFIIHSKKNEEESIRDLESVFQSGRSIGMISDAGCPVIADPGSKLVQLAHRMGIQVIPLTGPSSIFLALMASGMNGQNFSFNGYLPIENDQRAKAIRELENSSRKERKTQLFMETPYRNDGLLAALIAELGGNTKLGVARELSTENELIIVKKISEWKQLKSLPDLKKRPTIFLLEA